MDYNPYLRPSHGYLRQQQHDDTQPADDASHHGMFGWMSAAPHLSPESLPRAPEPLIFDGYIPNAQGAYPPLIVPGAPLPQDEPSQLATNSLPVLHRNGEELEDDDEDSQHPSTLPPLSGQPRSSRQSTDELHRHQSENGMPDVADTQIDEEKVASGDRPKKRGRPRKPEGSLAQPRRRGRPKKSKGEGKRGGWSKGMKVGPRPALEASPQFNALYAEAVQALLESPPQPQKTVELITQAIALNPEQHRAHQVLAEAHYLLGNDEEAINVLFLGAHANPKDYDTWKDVLDKCLEYTGDGRRAALEKAMIACSELIGIDKDDLETHFRRATILREQGRPQKCINELHKVLKGMPYNSSALEEYGKACIDAQLIPKAIDLYKEAIEHYLEVGLGGEETFGWSDVGMYAELVMRNGQPQETLPSAIKVLKKLSRWLQGRQAETYWEDKDHEGNEQWLKDDSEFDMADEPRRIRVPQYMPGRRHPEDYGLGLPIELRAQLGILRLRRGDRSEAMAHFGLLLEADQEGDSDYVHQVPDLLLQVAKALTDTKEHGEALRFFEALKKAEAIDSHEFWIGIGHSSNVCNKKEQALECFQKALTRDKESVEAKTWVAKLLVEKDNKHEALESAREAVEIAQSRVMLKEGTRVYERKGARLLREDAERTLKQIQSLLAPKVRKRYKKRVRPEPEDEPSSSLLPERQSKRLRQPDDSARVDDTPVDDEIEADEADEAPVDDTPKPKRKNDDRHRTPRKLKVVALPDEDEAGRQERVLQYYTTLLNNADAMRASDPVARGIWIDCANSLIDDFKSNKAFFPTERHSAKTNSEWIDVVNRIQATTTPTRPESRSPSQADNHTSLPTEPIPTTYRTIPFTTWLDIFLSHALLLCTPLAPSTVPSPHLKLACYSTINTALDCIIFTSHPVFPSQNNISSAIFQTRITHLICCLSFRDEKQLFNNVLRWFIREHAFCTDAYRLFGAMNYYFPYFQPGGSGGKEGVMQRSAWRGGNVQKFLRRHVYAIDKNLVDGYADEEEGVVPEFMRKERDETFLAHETRREVDPDTGAATTKKVLLQAKEMDVVLLVLYGQILYATGSFVSALSYFYRARVVDPDNPLVLLSIALSYMHQMMKRQEANRHVTVLQGWAMFQEYEDKRVAWARRKEEQGEKGVIEEVRREIVFNKARCWEMIGCAGLAQREYEKLLEGYGEEADAPGEQEDGVDGGKSDEGKWTMEAAYAMSNMYMVGGDKETARMIAEKYLVVE